MQLPEFGIPEIKAKIDTGADNSSLHAFNMKRYERDGVPYISFQLHPRQRKKVPSIPCEAEVVMERKVKNPGGRSELRPVIRTTLVVAGREIDALVNLTTRDDMTFRLLLGRRTIRKHFIVDPGKSYVGLRPTRMDET